MTPTFSYGTLASTPTGTHSQTESPHFTVNIMQNSKNKEALRLAEWLEKPEHDGSVCAEHIESATELRRQHDLLGKANALCRIRAARIAELEARMEVAARPEIASLRTDHMQALAAHPQNAEKLPRVPLHETVRRMADRIEELQDQLEAIGAGGVEPLRKREWLHKISEPAQEFGHRAQTIEMAANVAGLESAVAHLSCLLDAFRALLVEVDDVCGRDGFDRVLEEGESEIIDKIRAALAMTNAAPKPAAPAQAGEYPELPMQFACSGVFTVYSANQMRAYADATCAARGAAQAAPVATDSDDALMAREMYESQDDSLLLCASDLQHSAIYDNHIEMQSCIRAVADRITALASVIAGVERAALASPAQPVGWAIFAENGNGLMWTQSRQNAEASAKNVGLQVTPLYAAPQSAAPAQAGEYPPLPYPGGNIEQGGGWVAPTKFFTADQMRAYVDADRAARGAAQAAPVDAAVQRDADRYRWLKITAKPGEPYELFEKMREAQNLVRAYEQFCKPWNGWDATIDAARAAQGAA